MVNDYNHLMTGLWAYSNTPRPPQPLAAATSARHSPDPADVPILQSAPIPAQPTMEIHHRRKGKTTAGRVITRSDQSSPDKEATHQPAQKRRRRHIITSDSDDDCSAAVPTSSADPSLFYFLNSYYLLTLFFDFCNSAMH
ncbi:hypothetical protein V6N13_024742 [Hibiscus sabdariffa]